MTEFPISPDGSEFVEIVDAAEPVRILPSDSGMKVESGMALCLSGRLQSTTRFVVKGDGRSSMLSTAIRQERIANSCLRCDGQALTALTYNLEKMNEPFGNTFAAPGLNSVGLWMRCSNWDLTTGCGYS